jgi:DNA-directed RNA polymerase specialized sigma24 family protein
MTNTTITSSTRPGEHDALILATYQHLQKRRDRNLDEADNADALQQCVVRLMEQIHVLATRYTTPVELAAVVWASAARDYRRTQRIQQCQGAQLVARGPDRIVQPKRQVTSLIRALTETGDRPTGRRADWIYNIEDGYTTVELRYDLIALLGLLPPKIKQLLWLVRVECHEVTDAAELLGWSRCHASRQLHKTEARLRRLAAAME